MLVYRAAPMEQQGWLTLAVVLLTLFAMVRELAGPDLILMAGLFTLAAFILVAVSAARRGLQPESESKSSPTGGYALYVTNSGRPITATPTWPS